NYLGDSGIDPPRRGGLASPERNSPPRVERGVERRGHSPRDAGRHLRRGVVAIANPVSGRVAPGARRKPPPVLPCAPPGARLRRLLPRTHVGRLALATEARRGT